MVVVVQLLFTIIMIVGAPYVSTCVKRRQCCVFVIAHTQSFVRYVIRRI